MALPNSQNLVYMLTFVSAGGNITTSLKGSAMKALASYGKG